MLHHLRPAVVTLLGMTVLIGLAYPLAVTAIAQLAFPWQANGSLIQRDGRVIGSALVGQAFASRHYFWSRPSAADYDAAASSGSNLAPTSKALVDRVRTDIAKLRAQGAEGALPADLVTTSGSGLDPHLSPEAALLQVSRVARERNLEPARVRELVERMIEGRTLGLLGEARVNVLQLNLALDDLSAR